MEWTESLRWLVGLGVFLVPLVMLVAVGLYVVVMPWAVLAGMILKGTQQRVEKTGADRSIRHAH